ncbi:MAG: hypothetical protein J0H18_18125 [Rhizobiales bacterium]|nr:hypothetical protein [Hyphomicrobiales bacterium]
MRARGQNGGLRCSRRIDRLPTTCTAPADGRGKRTRTNATRCRTGDGKTAVTAATAERLHQHAARLIAMRFDRPADQSGRCARIAAGTAGAANAGRDSARANPACHRAGNGITAGTATATDRLDNDACRLIALRIDTAIRFSVSRAAGTRNATIAANPRRNRGRAKAA